MTCVFVCAGHNSEPCKTAEQIEIPSGGADSRGSKNHVLDRDTCWQHLANTIEWSVLDDDIGCRFRYHSN